MDNIDDQFPESFKCPLTLQVMKDPVVDHEGNSYEREAIEQWLDKYTTSPVTRNPLDKSNLVPNRALRDAIEEKRKALMNGNNDPVVAPVQIEKKQEVVQRVEQKVEEEDRDKVTVSIAASQTGKGTEATVLVSVKPPSADRQTPCDIVCVVDVSGSMDSEATMQNENGVKETHGLSLLDVVKHAVKTIINVLEPTDRLALVSFSSTATKVFDFLAMDTAGKAKAEAELAKLRADGGTNLWDGLHKGLEIIRESNKGRLGSVLLLTDGQPNVVPPRGHIPMLQKYKDDYQLSCTINTFGFGYNLDSALLNDLAAEGNGMYAFIPDSGFVGTVFVNSTSNLQVTMAKNVQVSLEPLNGASLEENAIIGGLPYQTTSWGAAFSLGSLQFEQPKNIAIRMKVPDPSQPYLRATVKYETKDGAASECSAEGTSFDKSQEIEVEAHRHRLVTLEVLRQAMKSAKAQKYADAQKSVANLIKEIKESKSAKSDARVKALLQDLEGQVTEAFSRNDWYSKWGGHYLPSLINAHLLQVCNNFKDPGVQLYGGKLFKKLRDHADEVFIKLPPPQPSRPRYSAPASSYHSSSGSTPTSPAKPLNMRVFHNSGNACFHGDSMVKMANGTFKKASQIIKGDKVMTPSNGSSEVLCIVKTVCANNTTDLVELPSGLIVTPYHPIRVSGQWKFPCDVATVSKRACDAVYSFVLKTQHVMIINEVECVSLGHQLKGEVVEHEYFGSHKILQDLQNMRGWNSGLVELKPELIRDIATGLVCGLCQ